MLLQIARHETELISAVSGRKQMQQKYLLDVIQRIKLPRLFLSVWLWHLAAFSLELDYPDSGACRRLSDATARRAEGLSETNKGVASGGHQPSPASQAARRPDAAAHSQGTILSSRIHGLCRGFSTATPASQKPVSSSMLSRYSRTQSGLMIFTGCSQGF